MNNLKMSRREVLALGASSTAGAAASSLVAGNAVARTPAADHPKDPTALPPTTDLSLEINGRAVVLQVDNRTTLLDALREQLRLTGTKKGCDQGQCGACTVLLDGRRINSCLTLAVMHDGASVTTIEGLGTPERLHPLQAAFVKHDGFQCGYCTPGQICSAVGALDEIAGGMPSFAATDPAATPKLSAIEMRERMSGNLCRCGAYPNIIAAILDASEA
ncbi:aldehyde dehydrogenase iron-sulfur subunit PaoA [Cupriavidus agavae]|uniref:Xanthine dehydrogenase YagT iron-sulfur-binding subunit n=1 Tax=Cupriavidus agavae TaxID=1001822 RepID=A0A4Q7R8D6_9BURK|nr:aldehyde dehydrogenase iron-sulfur subunit PaoA [Cupriavidus agavae]RZT29066.1 xanthine dehydrogenase YagT iron-sulfur-binding subunit [Cupriavidus agavae]